MHLSWYTELISSLFSAQTVFQFFCSKATAERTDEAKAAIAYSVATASATTFRVFG